MVRPVLGLALLAALLLHPPRSQAEPTNHGNVPPNWLAGDLGNRTLTVASPGPVYVVYGDLTIGGGATLTIEPGVTIQPVSFSDFLASGTFRDKVEIIVRGTLNAEGTIGAPISFVPTGGDARLAWGGLVLDGGAITLSNATITSAAYAVRDVSGGQVTLTHVTACPNENGFSLLAATGSVRASTLCGYDGGGNNSDLGIALGPDVSTATVDSLLPEPTLIRNFSMGAYLASGAHAQHLLIRQCYKGLVPASPNTTASYCTVVSNSYGMTAGNVASARLYNSIIAYSAYAAFFSNTTSFTYPVDLGYVDVWSNGDFDDIPNNWGGRAVASFDPMFVSPGGADYRLSPLSLFTDFSVSGGAIGAYGPGPGPPSTTVVEDIREAGTLLISPNPSVDGRLAIAFDAPDGGDVSVEVLDVSGRRVWLEHIPGLARGAHSSIVGTRLAKGVYWLRVTSRTSRQGRRFVVLG